MAAAVAVVVACVLLADMARSDVGPPPDRREAAGGVLFEDLERFPDHAFFVLAKEHVWPVEPGWAVPTDIGRRGATALWAVARPAPSSVDRAFVERALAEGPEGSVARSGPVYYDATVAAADAGAGDARVVDRYRVVAVSGRTIELETLPTRIHPAGTLFDEGPAGFRPRAAVDATDDAGAQPHEAPSTPPTPAPGSIPPWPFLLSAAALVSVIAMVYWRRKKRR